jgi:hypothetical protein
MQNVKCADRLTCAISREIRSAVQRNELTKQQYNIIFDVSGGTPHGLESDLIAFLKFN